MTVTISYLNWHRGTDSGIWHTYNHSIKPMPSNQEPPNYIYWYCRGDASDGGSDYYDHWYVAFSVKSTNGLKRITVNNVPIRHIRFDDESDFYTDGEAKYSTYTNYLTWAIGGTITNVRYRKPSIYIYREGYGTHNELAIEYSFVSNTNSIDGLTYDVPDSLKNETLWVCMSYPCLNTTRNTGWNYEGIQLYLDDFRNAISAEEYSYDISVSASIDGEVYLSDGNYRINGDSQRTISYSASGDFVDTWVIDVNGGGVKTGSGSVSSTYNYTFQKKPYSELQRAGIVAYNNYNTQTLYKYYHVGGVPTINTPSPVYYDYVYPQTPDTSTTRYVDFTGTYYSQISDSSSWVAEWSGGYISLVSKYNIAYNANTGFIQTRFYYKLGASPGTQYASLYFSDSNYGSTPWTHAYFYVCVHPSVSCTATTTTPDVGTSVTITNTSSENSSVVSRYNWYDGDMQHPISGMQGVAKSKTYTYTPSNTTNKTIIIEGYDNLHSGYTNKPTTSITISPVSPVPKPTVTYSPSTFYYADNVNLSITESFQPTVQISYQWYVNGSAVSGATSKTYTVEDIRSTTTVYVKSSYNGLVETSDTVTLTPSSPAPSTSTSYSPSTIYGNYTKLNVRCYVTSKLSNCEITKYSIEVRKTNSTGEIVYSNSVTTSALEYTFEIPVLPPGIYYIKNNKYYTYTGTSGNTYSSYQYGTSTKTYLDPVPTPAFTIVTPSPVYEGQEIYCRNDTIEPGFSVSYEWKVNGVVGGHNRDLRFTAEVGVSVYTIELTAINGSYTSSTVSHQISVMEYYDPMKRWTIVITDGKTTHSMFTHKPICPNTFMQLKFEHRLNEVGLGSVTLMCKCLNEDGTKTNEEKALKANNKLLIYDNRYLIYEGIITSVDQRNNFGIGSSIVSEKMTYKLFDIEFAEFTRSLTYKQPLSNNIGVATGTLRYDIVPKINSTSLTVGAVKYTGNCSFNIDESNCLNQLDMLCDQFNLRYRMKMVRHVADKAMFIYNDGSRWKVQLSYTPYPPTTSTYLFYQTDYTLSFSIIYHDEWEVPYIFYISSHKEYGTQWSGTVSVLDGACFAEDAKVELADTFYSESVGLEDFVINKNCYDTSNQYKTDKEYGSITVISPNTSGKSISSTVKLVKRVNNDGSSTMYSNYISKSYDCIVYKAEKGTFGDISMNLYVIGEFYGPSPRSVISYINPETGERKYGFLNNTDTRTTEIVEINGQLITVTCLHNILDYSGLSGISIGKEDRLIGAYIWGPKYIMENNLSGGSLYLGGEKLASDEYSYSGNTIELNFNKLWERRAPFIHSVGIPVYTGTEESDSPYKLYPDTALTVTVQDGLTYQQVEQLAFNLSRYNSNFTLTTTGSCALKHWTDKEYRFPYVGEALTIKSLEPGSEEDTLECNSYTINADEMRCDFNLGMKPITIGDVIYRIKSNQMTNIN